jgi:hypothetical protein
MNGSRRNKEKKGSFSIPGTAFSEWEEKRRNEQSFMPRRLQTLGDSLFLTTRGGAGGHTEMSSILADQKRHRTVYEPRGWGGDCRGPAIK